LTGVYNMRAFNVILQRTFRQAVRYGHPLSVLMIDSDNLKTINDAYGHDAGNLLLRHLVNRIREGLRSSDVVARFGGDEFIVLLTETGPQGAVEVAERIRRAVEDARLDLGGNFVRTTVSVGVASHPTGGVDLAMLLERADQALYRAKQSGKNRVVTHSDPQGVLPFDSPRMTA
jgi:two-component system, cell cycle response regulator